MPRILITNDDSIHAPGIYALYQAMSKLGQTYVVAPDAENSAVGHAITLSDPLRVFEFEKFGKFFGWAVNGTPADCVKLAVKALLDFVPDLVVSGINQGGNTATNIIYSGTVSAATEGTIMGIPSVAFSLASYKETDFAPAGEVAAIIAQKVLDNGLPAGTLLNVNIPPVSREELRGIRITRQGKGRFEESVEKRVDPTNRTYYWLAGTRLFLDSDDEVDDVAVRDQYVSVTPLQYNLTDEKSLETLRGWNLKLG